MEPSRCKVHWDYLIDEVEWLAIDMKNRLNWKILAARIIAESAKTYVFVKEEIKSLEFIQIQEEARLKCSRIANMIKEWWQEKRKTDIFESINCKTENCFNDYRTDFCQVWLSNNLINAESQADKLDSQYDKSDSDSLCSFDSSQSYCSIMLNDEEHIYANDESSFDISDDNSPMSNLIDELNWLENDMELNDSEMKFSFENEINELKILSQTPLEYIIDENYFLNSDIMDTKSINSSDSFDTESLLSDVLSHEANDIFNKTEPTSSSYIVSRSEKIQELLSTIIFSEPLSISSHMILEELLKYEFVNRNIQVILELIKQKYCFSIVSSLQCGDDKFIISILFAYLSYKLNFTKPQLIITTRSQIFEWQSLLSKICSDCKIIVLDSYLSLESAIKVFENIDNSTLVISIISYAALSTPFCVTSVTWHNIIYDQVEKLCENSSSIPEIFFLPDANLTGVRIGLISEDSNFPTKNHCINLFFRLFYSALELEELFNELQCSDVAKYSLKYHEKLKTIVQNHCVPLQRIYDPGTSYQVIMCELTQFQQSLHQCVVNKLKKSLESNNLLDIVEAICQDIQLSQHPFCFEYTADVEAELFSSFRNQYMYSNSMPTYYLSKNDTLSLYIPRKILSGLSLKVSNDNVLLYNLCDLASIGFTKYEMLRMRNLLISTSNVDYLMNKIPACLSDTDEEYNQSTNKNEFTNDSSSGLVEHNEFLSTVDLENLRFEWKDLSEIETANLKCPSYLISDSKHDNENGEKDLQMSSTLAARRSKTKFKSRLTSLSKENEKYGVFLNSSDYSYLTKHKVAPVDLNIRMKELDSLANLCSIYTHYLDSITDRYAIFQDKVISRPPKLLPLNKSELILKNYNYRLVQSISQLFHVYLSKAPRINTKLYHIKKDEINLSGKLRTLNSILIRLATDSSIKTCVILSHSFELLNLIESLIFISRNYGVFIKFRLNSCRKENDEKLFSMIEKFNKCQMRNKKTILLVHTRTNYQLLQHINIDSCSIIIADSHWQTDSDQLIFKMINRWNLNSMLSRGHGISSIYKLCTFESLEQYFLTNDLSFLYDNSYRDKHGLVTTTSAVVSQQSLLKHFVDKLISPLKEELISGFCVDDFQPALQKKGNLLKLSDESIVDIFNSFENAYDLLQLCHYRSVRNMLSYEFTHLTDISNEIISNHNFHQIPFDEPNCSSNILQDTLRRRENYRIKRQNKLSHLLDFTKDQESFLFYDSKQLQLQDAGIWMPPLLDDSLKIVQTEILDMYDLNPIQDTELSIHLVPVKSYPTKSNKKWDDKASNSNIVVKEETTLVTPDYSDIDRMKKRKLSNDYQVGGEYSQYSLNQKKRKIFTNRRYFTENETDITTGQNNLKARYKIEKKIMNESEMQNIDIKEILDIKRQSPIVGDQPPGDVTNHSLINQSTIPNQNNPTQSFDVGKSNSILLCTNDNLMKINLQRPFYSKEGLRTLKIKRQQISTGNMSSLPAKTNMITGSNAQNYAPQQRPTHNHRGQLFLNTKLGSNSEVTPQSNGEGEYEKLPEWNIHEEAVLYQNISHYQDHPFSINTFEKLLPNFKICEHYLNFYSITNTHRSSDMCKIHFTKLQMGFLNQNKGDNNLTRLNRQSNILNPAGVSGIRSINETRPVIGGVTGRKLKIKMKNSIGTYGTSIFGSTQAMTNKIKMFQCFLNDMKLNLMQTNQIVNSCLNSFDNRTTMTFKMLDEVVNTSKLPSFLPNHSQTIKKNATHISALEEHNIHPDKIFTPAMLIQRREEIDKDRESESTIINTNQNRQQIVTSVSSSSYRNVGYFETNPINSSTHSLNHIRRTTSTNIGSGQNVYSLQTASNNQVVSRARYNLPINRQMSGATVIHQQNTNQIQSSSSSMTSNITSSSNSSVPQNQATSLGSRSQSVQFQIQHTRNASSIPRRTSSQQVFQRLVYPTNYQSLRQNQLMNRGSTAFVRPIIPTVVNQSNSQNTTTNNSIISVFPNSVDQNNSGISRTLDRSVNFNITNQIRGHNVRTNIATVSSSNRGNMNQIPRMLHVNQINRNNMNVNSNINRNQEQ